MKTRKTKFHWHHGYHILRRFVLRWKQLGQPNFLSNRRAARESGVVMTFNTPQKSRRRVVPPGSGLRRQKVLPTRRWWYVLERKAKELSTIIFHSTHTHEPRGPQSMRRATMMAPNLAHNGLLRGRNNGLCPKQTISSRPETCRTARARAWLAPSHMVWWMFLEKARLGNGNGY